MTRPGRPRSLDARTAVLHAVDDLLVEVGYAAVTMKGVAERAGVGRQTVYRWWSTPAEILLEACVEDAAAELATDPQDGARAEVLAYLRTLETFLLRSHAGAAYRALLGAAQHDEQVRRLVADADVLAPSAHECLARLAGHTGADAGLDVPELVGPLLYTALTGSPSPDLEQLAEDLLHRGRRAAAT